jgi:hypothetical protein
MKKMKNKSQLKISINEKKRLIEIKPQPTENIINGIRVTYNPSKYWIKNHIYEEPIMFTDTYKGVAEYRLPKYFRIRSIKEVEIV